MAGPFQYDPGDYAALFANLQRAPQPSFQPGMMGRGMPLDASSRLPRGSAGIDPVGWRPQPAMPAPVDVASMPMPTANAYAGQPLVNPALAATATMATPPVTNYSGRMQPRQDVGGLLSLLFGQSKNGLGGLAGLLGGPQQGGLLQMLMSGQQQPASSSGALSPSQEYERSRSEESETAWAGGKYGNDGTPSYDPVSDTWRS